MKLFKILILILFSFLLVSCEIKDINVSIPEKVEVQELSLNNIKIKIFLPIENNNNFSFKIKDVNLNLFVNDINVGKINKFDKLKIEPNSKNVYPIYFEIATKDAISNAITLYNEFKKSNPKLSLNGHIKVSKLGVSRKIKINQNYKN